MVLALYLGVAVMIFGGAFSILTNLFYVPNAKILRNLKSRVTVTKPRLSDRMLKPVIAPIAGMIHLNPFKLRKLRRDLERAHINMTPEQYCAAAILKGTLMACTGVFAYAAGIQLAAFGLAACGVIVYMQEMRKVDDLLKEKDGKILLVLPHFANVVTDGLQRSTDIAGVFSRYLHDVPNTPLYDDLNSAIVKMRANGSVQETLRDMDMSINNKQLSVFLSALIEVSKGSDQAMFLELSAREMDDLRIENIKRSIASRPRKIRRASLGLAVSIAAVFIVPLILSIFNSQILF